MDCIALYDSGNYAYRICRVFEQKGLVFEVISTPCRVSRTGCGYCLKFPEEYLNRVVAESRAYQCPVREAFRVVASNGRNHYVNIL